jgi:hypothetical protein
MTAISSRGQKPLAERNPAWHVNQFRDGKVIRWRVYTSESEALEAAGLSE